MLHEVLNIIASMSLLKPEEIEKDDRLFDIGIDSLKMVEMIVRIEDTFHIKFDDSEIDPVSLTTVKSVEHLLNKYIL